MTKIPQEGGEKATRALQRIRQLRILQSERPDDLFIRYAIATETEKSGDLKAAIILLQELLEKAPEYLGAYYQLGKFHEADQNPGLAKKVYTAGIEVARAQSDGKTLSELQEAVLMIGDD